jgi:DUF4097 and DUF4098 domain-containing protein YvlB
MDRRALLASTGSVFVASLAGCLGVFDADVTSDFENSYDVTDGATLAVDNRNGDVNVESADGDQLVVAGEKRASSESALETIQVDVTGEESVAVDVTFESGAGFSSRSVDLTVAVPDGVTVEAAASSNGDVTVEDVTGDVAATTSNGEVEMTDVDGYVRCETSNGDVRARGTTGLTGARTSNGTVDVELLAMRGDVTCRSTNGSVTCRVGPDVAAAIELTTSNGDATVRDLEHTVSRSRESSIEGELRGGGDTRLRLVSSNGDVTLRPAED